VLGLGVDDCAVAGRNRESSGAPDGASFVDALSPRGMGAANCGERGDAIPAAPASAVSVACAVIAVLRSELSATRRTTEQRKRLAAHRTIPILSTESTPRDAVPPPGGPTSTASHNAALSATLRQLTHLYFMRLLQRSAHWCRSQLLHRLCCVYPDRQRGAVALSYPLMRTRIESRELGQPQPLLAVQR
jgi:hypothetical protein